MSSTITNLGSTGSIITDQGSPFSKMAYVTTSGSTLVLDSNIITNPALKSFEVSVNAETKETELADGSVFPLAGGKTTGDGKMVTVQNDGNTMKYAETHGGKYACQVFEINDTPINGKQQICIVPYGLISKSRKLAKPGNEIEIGFKPAKSPYDLSVNLADWTSGNLYPSPAGSVTVPKGTYSMVHEYTIA